jgi:DNA-binding protein H-NS
MSKPTLDSIATAKAKLTEELRNLEAQEAELHKQQAVNAFGQVISLVTQYGKHFSAKQKDEIVAVLGVNAAGRTRKEAGTKEVAPKYWLPHTQETWSGRGRPPRSFTAWEGTAAYKEWKSTHPNEKFPSFPG